MKIQDYDKHMAAKKELETDLITVKELIRYRKAMEEELNETVRVFQERFGFHIYNINANTELTFENNEIQRHFKFNVQIKF